MKATLADVAAARAAWAADFMNHCLAKKLEVIAITDHHEMTMVPYVQAEFAKRREADPSFDIWLFPGMELTASGGVQCLIPFYADLSPDWQRQAQGKLGIAYADFKETAAVGLKVTQLKLNYPAIGPCLDELEALRRGTL